MKTYILLLRGINVGGHRKIKMADLKLQLSSLDLKEIRTYIQSGNVVFKSRETADALKGKIENKIEDHFGFEVKIYLTDFERFAKIYTKNPFINKNEEINKLYCTLLFESPEDSKIQALEAVESKDDVFIVQDEVLYFCYHNGYGKAKITNPFIEQKLKVNATTRNWKTMGKLMEMASE